MTFREYAHYKQRKAKEPSKIRLSHAWDETAPRNTASGHIGYQTTTDSSTVPYVHINTRGTTGDAYRRHKEIQATHDFMHNLVRNPEVRPTKHIVVNHNNLQAATMPQLEALPHQRIFDYPDAHILYHYYDEPVTSHVADVAYLHTSKAAELAEKMHEEGKHLPGYDKYVDEGREQDYLPELKDFLRTTMPSYIAHLYNRGGRNLHDLSNIMFNDPDTEHIFPNKKEHEHLAFDALHLLGHGQPEEGIGQYNGPRPWEKT